MPIRLTFDSDRASIFEVQAAILAILAWPEEVPDGANLAKAQVALCGHLIRAAVTADPSFALRLQPMKPVYLLQSHDEVSIIVANALNRLRDALRAARISRPLVAETLGEAPPLPHDLERLSLNRIVEWVLGAEGDPRSAHRFEEKVVRRTYPVLHLALALEYALHEAEAATGRPPSLEAWMLHDGACATILQRAAALEPVVLAIKRFSVDPEKQVSLRLAASAARDDK